MCTCCDKLIIQIQILGLQKAKKVRCLNSKVDWDPEAEVYMFSSFCSALSFFCKSTGHPLHAQMTTRIFATLARSWIHTFERSSLCQKACERVIHWHHLDDLASGGEADWRAFSMCKSCCSHPLPPLTFASDVSTITIATAVGLDGGNHARTTRVAVSCLCQLQLLLRFIVCSDS